MIDRLESREAALALASAIVTFRSKADGSNDHEDREEDR
jgi:hypothetical protein